MRRYFVDELPEASPWDAPPPPPVKSLSQSGENLSDEDWLYNSTYKYRALSEKANDAFYRLTNTRSQIQALQEETMLVGGLLSILQLLMGKATVGDASNCRNKPDKASVFMLQADCKKITLLGDEFRSRNMGP
ncbi:hypothetical protein OROMI_002867 [Orobanche minor]